MKDTDQNKYLNLFIQFVKIEKNYSSNTIKAYEDDLTLFFNYCSGYCTVGKIAEIDKDVLRAYLGFLHKREYKTSTINRKMASLRSFFGFLTKRDYIEKNPCESISSLKSAKSIPSWIGIDDMFVFLDSIRWDTWMKARNKAVFELMYSTGIRVSEAVAINREDLDPNGYIKIKGKGNKERILPVGKKALFYLEKYIEFLKTGEGVVSDTGPMFLNKYKKRISDRSIRRILDELIKKAGLHFKISPHKIRHSFATHMLDNGADLRFIQEFLNHKSLSTTQKYTHVTMERLMEVYDNSHPRN